MGFERNLIPNKISYTFLRATECPRNSHFAFKLLNIFCYFVQNRKVAKLLNNVVGFDEDAMNIGLCFLLMEILDTVIGGAVYKMII
jgi:hypothetical protein